MASRRGAILVVNAVRNAGGENVAGLQIAVVMVLEEAPMERVAARLHDHVDYRAACSTHFGIVRGGTDVDGADGIGRQNDGRKVVVPLDVIVEPLDHEVVQPVQPVDWNL